MPNKKAKNIWIKKLDNEDRTMLQKLRAVYSTSANSEAVMKASYEYFDNLKQIEKLKNETRTLIGQVDTLNNSLENIKEAIKEYFEVESIKEKHLFALKKLSFQKTPVKRQGTVLSELLEA